MALRVRSHPAPAAEAQEGAAFAQQPSPSRPAKPRGASPASQLHGRVAKLYSIDNAVARQEAQGPWGVCWPWCSAVGLLAPRHAFLCCTDCQGSGHLRSWCSLQLQEVDIFLHPAGVGVGADLPPLPGGEPVDPGGEMSAPESAVSTFWAPTILFCDQYWLP